MILISGLTRIELDTVERAAAACAGAFADDPPTLFLIPNRKKRANLHFAFEYYLRMCILSGGDAYTTSPDCEAVAVWAFSSAKESFWNAVRAGYPFLPLRCGWRFLVKDAQGIDFCNKIRNQYAPARHCYLELLAVAPGQQGKGYASLLVRPMLQKLDQRGMPCYLETQSQRNVSIYQHLGFSVVHETCMPGTEFPLYSMLRSPVCATQP